MAVAIFTSFGAEVDSNGVPLSGGTITVYDAGTTTPRALYSNTGLSVAADNPITLDANGRHDMRYVSATAYKVLVKNSSGTTIYTRDNIDPGVPIGTGALPIANGGTGATDASAALTNLGAATTAQITALSEDVAEIAGAVGSTGSTKLATGTTAQRPTEDLTEGMIRRNTTTHRTEGYNDSAAWENYLTDTEIASQSDMETGTSTTKVVPVGRQHYHPGMVKAWARVQWTSGVPAIVASYNFSGTVFDHTSGDVTLDFATAFSANTYAAIVTAIDSSNAVIGTVKSASTTQVRIALFDSNGVAVDNLAASVVVLGDI